MRTLLQTPTPNLAQSKDFYTRLGFKDVSTEERTLLADGKAVIEINPHRFARAGLKLFQASWEETVSKLHTQTVVLKNEEGYQFCDPSGVWVYLVEGELDLPFEVAPPSVLGNMAGMSIETPDMKRSAELWEVLGFEKIMGALEDGWVVYQNEDEVGVSFMRPNTCPHLFFNPSLTYFNGGKNLPVIEKIRSLGIPITEEISVFNQEGLVDNVIVRDPGGLGFFVFND